MPPSREVKEVGPHRVARALHKMAEDLVTERRRVVLLERENRELRSQLEELQRAMAAEREPGPVATHDRPKAPARRSPRPAQRDNRPVNP